MKKNKCNEPRLGMGGRTPEPRLGGEGGREGCEGEFLPHTSLLPLNKNTQRPYIPLSSPYEHVVMYKGHTKYLHSVAYIRWCSYAGMQSWKGFIYTRVGAHNTTPDTRR